MPNSAVGQEFSMPLCLDTTHGSEESYVSSIYFTTHFSSVLSENSSPVAIGSLL
jgi:hypothetical protein